MENFEGLWFDCEESNTSSSEQQCACEQMCSSFLKSLSLYSEEALVKFQSGQLVNENKEICLLRSMHEKYLVAGLSYLPGGFCCLDSSRPWIIYWILHGLYLLEQCADDRQRMVQEVYPNVISTLRTFQNSSGGFGGGPQQISHGAPNFASVLALCTIGSDEALESIDRQAMYSFFQSVKSPVGGFCMHDDGEVDSRSTYTIIAIARILNLLTDELMEGVVPFLLACQTYEGGFGGEVANEAHGGYNFCALASLHILGKANECNLAAQEYWLVQRQLRLEGGFQGRTNKLVDSCYSYWQGAAVALLDLIKSGGDDIADCVSCVDGGSCDNTSSTGTSTSPNATIRSCTATSGKYLFNQEALQRYVLHCAQQLEGGGLRDKPGKARDYYHSCYALSGLSVAQQSGCDVSEVYGDSSNLLQPTSIVFNIGCVKLLRAIEYFKHQPFAGYTVL